VYKVLEPVLLEKNKAEERLKVGSSKTLASADTPAATAGMPDASLTPAAHAS
jgi:hypothetical protein